MHTPCSLAKISLISLLTFAPVAFAGEPGQHEDREGDEIVAAGQFFHTGTKVVLWMDPGGYDAYRVEKRFVPLAQASTRDPHHSPSHFGMVRGGLNTGQIEKVRGGGWDLPTLQSVVDQFVYHFDVEGCSLACFRTLQDKANLSVHFMLDLDGTIYQTVDCKENAWHATSSNGRSIGVEIANVGAYEENDKDPFNAWYHKEGSGKVDLKVPVAVGGPHPELTPNFVGHPARRDIVVGEVQAKKLRQYDFTPQQYAALAKLTATLCTIFPKIKCDYPRDAEGKLLTHKLANEELKKYEGVMGHYHIQTDKTDPGPALQWDFVIDQARTYMHLPPVKTVTGEIVTEPVKLITND